jgi:hypothetical protein
MLQQMLFILVAVIAHTNGKAQKCVSNWHFVELTEGMANNCLCKTVKPEVYLEYGNIGMA